MVHCVQHMLQLDQGTRPCSLEEMVDKYVLNIELVYGKLCVISSASSEETRRLESVINCEAEKTRIFAIPFEEV